MGSGYQPERQPGGAPIRPADGGAADDNPRSIRARIARLNTEAKHDVRIRVSDVEWRDWHAAARLFAEDNGFAEPNLSAFVRMAVDTYLASTEARGW